MRCEIVSGTWDFYLDRGCRGNHLRYEMVLEPNGTVRVGNARGVWTQVEGLVTLLLSTGSKPAYTANVSGSVMTGSFLFPENQSGCWYATKGIQRNGKAEEGSGSPADLD